MNKCSCEFAKVSVFITILNTFCEHEHKMRENKTLKSSNLKLPNLKFGSKYNLLEVWFKRQREHLGLGDFRTSKLVS